MLHANSENSQHLIVTSVLGNNWTCVSFCQILCIFTEIMMKNRNNTLACLIWNDKYENIWIEKMCLSKNILGHIRPKTRPAVRIHHIIVLVVNVQKQIWDHMHILTIMDYTSWRKTLFNLLTGLRQKVGNFPGLKSECTSSCSWYG